MEHDLNDYSVTDDENATSFFHEAVKDKELQPSVSALLNAAVTVLLRQVAYFPAYKNGEVIVILQMICRYAA